MGIGTNTVSGLFLSFKMTPHLSKLIKASTFYKWKRTKNSYCFLYYFLNVFNFTKKAHNHKAQGGDSPEKGVRGCAALKIPFSRLLLFTRPPVEAQVPSQDPHLKEKCDLSPPKQKHFLENMTIFSCRSSNLTAWKFCKISVLKPLFLMKICSQAPIFMAIYPITSPKFGNPGCTYLSEKSWVPPQPQSSLFRCDASSTLKSEMFSNNCGNHSKMGKDNSKMSNWMKTIPKKLVSLSQKWYLILGKKKKKKVCLTNLCQKS